MDGALLEPGWMHTPEAGRTLRTGTSALPAHAVETAGLADLI